MPISDAGPPLLESGLEEADPIRALRREIDAFVADLRERVLQARSQVEQLEGASSAAGSEPSPALRIEPGQARPRPAAPRVAVPRDEAGDSLSRLDALARRLDARSRRVRQDDGSNDMAESLGPEGEASR
jgi:hypothetical protein